MWNDEIVEEVRRVREAHAAKFNYDLREIARDIQRGEAKLKRAGWKFVTPSKPKKAAARKSTAAK